MDGIHRRLRRARAQAAALNMDRVFELLDNALTELKRTDAIKRKEQRKALRMDGRGKKDGPPTHMSLRE